MAFILTFVFVGLSASVHGTGCPFSAAIYSTASNIHKQRYEVDLSLWKSFSVKATDPGAVENTPFPWPDVNADELKRAENLLDYEAFIRNELAARGWLCDSHQMQNELAQYTECVPKDRRCSSRKLECNKTEMWRSYDGSCNNLENWNWGSRNTQYNRLLAPVYDDGINELRQLTVQSKPLIDPRKIGNILSRWDDRVGPNSNHRMDVVPNVFGVMIGQIITHDSGLLVKTKMTATAETGVQCCSSSFDKPLPPSLRNSHCLPIVFDKNDPFFSDHNVGCQNFIRAQNVLAKDCSLGGANKINLVGSYLDMHFVYASSAAESRPLRSLFGGKFRLNNHSILVELADGYQAGDIRVPQTPWLSLLHSIFYRFHNWLAFNMAQIHLKLDDEELFQKTRRINIAIFQHLVFGEWIPLFLGSKYSRQKRLTCKSRSGTCVQYNSTLDAANFVEFSQGAFRLSHTSIPSTVNYYSEDYVKLKSMPLSDTVDKPTLLENGYTKILRGMLKDPMRMNRFGCSGEVRNRFQKNYRGVGMDLCAVDILRGRDFGVAPYVDYFPLCAGVTIKNWRDLRPFFKLKHLRLMKHIYTNVKDIDLLVGVMVERKQTGVYGTIGACLVGEQFHRLKFGDRFFYTFHQNPNPFTTAQIQEIQRITFAELICWTTGLGKVPKRSLEIPSPKNPMIYCKDVRQPDFRLLMT